MAKFYGVIGYEIMEEVRPSVYKPRFVEREMIGDLTRRGRRFDFGSQVNGEMTITNTISIIADPYAMNHFQDMRYVVYQGAKWTISSVEVEYPRLLLTLGGVYNGSSGPSTST